MDRKEKLGILKKIEMLDWAALTVPVLKPDNSVRMCGDYKVMINPLPREELFVSMEELISQN